MIDIAPALVDAIKEQRAVLFLGAGASNHAKHPKGDQIPEGGRLRDLICDKFLAGKLKERPLNAVAAMAASEAGLSNFQKYIHDLFMPFEPADFHLLITQFRASKYPPAKPGVLRCEPLKAAYPGGFGAASHLLRGMRHQVPKLTILKHAHLDAPLFAAE